MRRERFGVSVIVDGDATGVDSVTCEVKAYCSPPVERLLTPSRHSSRCASASAEVLTEGSDGDAGVDSCSCMASEVGDDRKKEEKVDLYGDADKVGDPTGDTARFLPLS